MGPRISSLLRHLPARRSRALFCITAIYGCASALALAFGWGGQRIADLLAAWASLPIGVAICVFLWPALWDPAMGRRRRIAWGLVFTAQMLDLIASAGWGYGVITENVSIGAWPDVLYVFFYPLVAIACVLLYLELGGRLDTPRALIDAGTIAIGCALLLWFTALAPLGGMSGAEVGARWSVVGYGLGNAIALIAGALLAMQITDWRAERGIALLLVAMLVTLVADLIWVNAELRGEYRIGGASDVVYLVYYLCLLGAAWQLTQRRAVAPVSHALQGDLRGSLPVVALMVGMVAMLDDQLSLTTANSSVMIVAVVLAVLLVIAGQAFASREMTALNREVATRRFDERLTELVRRSSDLIAICDPDGVVRYVSPSCEALLGLTPAQVSGRSLEAVLGPEAAHVRAVFEEVLGTAHAERTAAFSRSRSDGEVRSYRMVMANLTHVESIRGVTLNIRDVSDAARLNDQLRTLAFHDSLTMLANRTLFADRVHEAIKRFPEGMTPAVLFIDLDNFKTVNDSLGHSAGDLLLREFAQRLVQCTRAGDTVARLGGDEFAVLVDHAVNVEAALSVARQVIEACRQPFELDGQQVRIGASIGVALSDRASNVERLLRNADAAMYAAKARGKGHAEVFAPEMLREARRRMRIENELADALDLEQLEAHYQPIVDLRSRRLVGVEALVRWRHPTRGLVPPGDFVPLAEETGQIVPMTRWMLERACRDLVRLQRVVSTEHGQGRGLRMAVNISSRYLNHGDIVADVRAVLAAHELLPECLILEVTESLLLENSARLERIFQELKAMGVRLALDDFGTGYSSLAYLHRFPIDILKIDRSFVQRLECKEAGNGQDSIALAKAILSLAAALGLETVAEGIEVEAQRSTLLALGCRTGQGHSFGAAMSLTDLIALQSSLAADPHVGLTDPDVTPLERRRAAE
jgi:diguanylate cyclase (GGDEF)-like protein/PAS domain S-box-containing protein